MLPILLLLVAEPQSASPTGLHAPPLNPAHQTAADIPVLGRTHPSCSPQTMPIRSAPAAAEDLLWRDTDPAIGLHLLLERRIAGCPAPLVVGYRQPGSTSSAPVLPPAASLTRRLGD